uniref:Uncharacterized protein n=1 Tax=Rhizophora mucronata TaxID=61149 RepID=A0A2P2QN97_RHIMU
MSGCLLHGKRSREFWYGEFCSLNCRVCKLTQNMPTVNKDPVCSMFRCGQ